MIALSSGICVKVEPTNPGQFLACCGLLELADRFWPGAEGWFEENRFCVACAGSLSELLAILLMDPPEELTTLDNDLPVRPLVAPLRFSFDGGATQELTLDAWMTIQFEKGSAVATGNPPWNFWSGRQTSLGIWLALRRALAEQWQKGDFKDPEFLFAQRILLSGRFGFDPGAAWTALDVGFSPDAQDMPVASSASVELLAAVGIQRFRPMLARNRRFFVYSTWGRPLAPAIASVSACGRIEVPPAQRFQGRVLKRGSYTALGFSIPVQGDSHE